MYRSGSLRCHAIHWSLPPQQPANKHGTRQISSQDPQDRFIRKEISGPGKKGRDASPVMSLRQSVAKVPPCAAMCFEPGCWVVQREFRIQKRAQARPACAGDDRSWPGELRRRCELLPCDPVLLPRWNGPPSRSSADTWSRWCRLCSYGAGTRNGRSDLKPCLGDLG